MDEKILQIADSLWASNIPFEVTPEGTFLMKITWGGETTYFEVSPAIARYLMLDIKDRGPTESVPYWAKAYKEYRTDKVPTKFYEPALMRWGRKPAATPASQEHSMFDPTNPGKDI